MNAQYQAEKRCLYVSRPYPRREQRYPSSERTKVAVTGSPGFPLEGKAWFHLVMDRMTFRFVDPVILVFGQSTKIVDKLTINWASDNWLTMYVYYVNNTYKTLTQGEQERDNEFIQAADFLIAFWDEEESKTKELVKKAKQAGVKTKVFTF